MKFDITTEPLNEEETNVILGAYDTARAAYDAVQRDAWENARAEFRDLCNAVAEWAAPEVHRRYELMRGANDVLMARQRALAAALANLLADPLGGDSRAIAQALVIWVNGGKSMSTVETGGPAFPSKKRVYRAGYETNEFEPVDGMMLRDYFAARAMQGLAAPPESDKWPADEIAKAAYQQADAMLAARKEKP